MRFALTLCLLSAPVFACMREVEAPPAELFVRRATRQLSDRDYEGALKTARTVVAADSMPKFASRPHSELMGDPSPAQLKAARRVAAIALVRLNRMSEARP